MPGLKVLRNWANRWLSRDNMTVYTMRTAMLLVAITLLIGGIDLARADYTLDDSVGLGRMFDGIGGLSGGGVR